MVKKSPRSTSTASCIETGFERRAKKFVEVVKRMTWMDHLLEKMETAEAVEELKVEAALSILQATKKV